MTTYAYFETVLRHVVKHIRIFQWTNICHCGEDRYETQCRGMGCANTKHDEADVSDTPAASAHVSFPIWKPTSRPDFEPENCILLAPSQRRMSVITHRASCVHGFFQKHAPKTLQRHCVFKPALGSSCARTSPRESLGLYGHDRRQERWSCRPVLASIGDRAPEGFALAHHVVQFDNPCCCSPASNCVLDTISTSESLKAWRERQPIRTNTLRLSGCIAPLQQNHALLDCEISEAPHIAAYRPAIIDSDVRHPYTSGCHDSMMAQAASRKSNDSTAAIQNASTNQVTTALLFIRHSGPKK